MMLGREQGSKRTKKVKSLGNDARRWSRAYIEESILVT